MNEIMNSENILNNELEMNETVNEMTACEIVL
jgi:hypothetical protein